MKKKSEGFRSIDSVIENNFVERCKEMTSLNEIKGQDNRDLILGFENEMRKYEPLEIKTTNYFCPGIYARQIFIPAGTYLTGQIHKTEHLNMISQGTIKIISSEDCYEISAPATIISKPGTKRFGFAVTDTVWTTFHPNPDNIKDVETLEKELVVSSFEELEKEEQTLIKGEE